MSSYNHKVRSCIRILRFSSGSQIVNSYRKVLILTDPAYHKQWLERKRTIFLRLWGLASLWIKLPNENMIMGISHSDKALSHSDKALISNLRNIMMEFDGYIQINTVDILWHDIQTVYHFWTYLGVIVPMGL